MGGFISLSVALDFPEAINRLVLADTNAGEARSCCAADSAQRCFCLGSSQRVLHLYGGQRSAHLVRKLSGEMGRTCLCEAKAP